MEIPKLRQWQEPLDYGKKLIISYRRKPSMPIYNRVLCLAMAKNYALIAGRTEEAEMFEKEIEDVLFKGYLEYVKKHLKKNDAQPLPSSQNRIYD